jgi:hypothetical protein
MKAQDAVNKLKTYVNKPRKDLPWLKGRTNMLDCSAAVSWVLNLDQPQGIISCGTLMDYFKQKKQWHTTGIPVAGDIVIFDWSGKRTGHDHTGIVITADKNNVHYTSADSTTPTPGFVTYGQTQPYKYITGYGRPHYER